MPSLTAASIESEGLEPHIHSANRASTTNNDQLEMLKLLQEMSRDMKENRALATTPRSPGGRQRRYGRKTLDD